MQKEEINVQQLIEGLGIENKTNSMTNRCNLASVIGNQSMLQLTKKNAKMINSLPGILSGLSRHHIIPDNILQLFWDKLSENAEKNDADAQLFNKLKSMVFQVHKKRYLGGSKIIKSEIDELEGFKVPGQYYDSTKEFETTQKLDLEHKTIDDMDKDDLKRMFVWMPSNIVIGTSERQLEPGDYLDREAMWIARLNSDNTQKLYALLLNYIEGLGQGTQDSIYILLDEHMNCPYINNGIGKFIKKDIKKVPERKFNSCVFDIKEGIYNEEILLEKAVKAVDEMLNHAQIEVLKMFLENKRIEYTKRLEKIREKTATGGA